MKKAIVIFILIFTVLAGIVVWFFNAGGFPEPKELLMLGGVVLLLGFSALIGVRRIRSVKKSQPAEDELSKGILRRAAGSAYYLSIYSWFILLYFSDNTEMQMHSFIGLGIMIMAVEFALAWVYHNYFSHINE